MPPSRRSPRQVYFEHTGSELQRGINLLRLAALLRRDKFRSIWILDRTTRPGARREACRHPRAHRARSWSAKLLHHQSRHRPQPFPRSSDRLALRADGGDERAARLDRAGFAAARENACRPSPTNSSRSPGHGLRSASAPRIPTRIGRTSIGRNLSRLRRRVNGAVFLVGGAGNFSRAQNFIAGSAGGAAVNACDLGLIEAAALLRLADLFVGPSSGPMNSRGGWRHRCFRAVRLDAGSDLFEIHPCDRAAGRTVGRRHAADFAGASAGAHGAFSFMAKIAAVATAFIAPISHRRRCDHRQSGWRSGGRSQLRPCRR